MNSGVSIVIPVYNAEKTLRKCVESLIYGVERNIEIILVDDYSKDNSWALCLQLQTEFTNVIAVRNEKNSGVSYTRNHGIKRATKEYIAFVDSDDWVSGKFISVLLHTAKEYANTLVTCGFYYVDTLLYNTVVYQWDSQNKKKLFRINQEELFDAVNKIMLQNVWNKIFSRKIIADNDIRFDENQSMGEDFQFVLDYMKASNVKECTIINQALYYYVKANQTSLMSNFAWSSHQNEVSRLRLLAEICGDDFSINQRLDKEINNVKTNRLYHVVRTKNKTKEQKIARIEEIYGDGEAKKHYYEQSKIKIKEQLLSLISNISVFTQRVKGKWQRIQREKIIRKAKKQLKNKDVSIISQNCIGGVFYHDMGIQFLSPTINLYFEQPDFVRFVLDLEKYLAMPLRMEWKEEYPIGKLGDITIHFMHYDTCDEAMKSWNRRKTRINFNKIVVISTDMEGFDDSVFKQWNTITYPKILFTVHEKYSNTREYVYFPKYSSLDHVPNLIPDREFYKNNNFIKLCNKTSAIVDRLTYKAYPIDREGDSYRLRETLRSNGSNFETVIK